MTTWETDYLNASVYSHAKSVGEAIELLTTGAAQLLGVSDDFGIIEQGKKRILQYLKRILSIKI